MKILLDTNVILDQLLRRQPGYAHAATIIRAARTHFTPYLAAFSLPTISYYSYRHFKVKVDNSNKAREMALKDVRSCLDQFEICMVSRQTLELAVSLSGRDFEDNLQIACAIEQGLDAIVTSNIKDFRAAGITLYTPVQLVKWLKLR